MQPITFLYSDTSIITINTLEKLLSLVPIYDEATNSRNLELLDEDLEIFSNDSYPEF